VRFTLRQLEYFVATCEAGSVTEAALSIPVSQSSVSAAVAQLEAAVGVQLLIRHHAQGVSPTPAGRRFLEHALELLSEAEQLERLAADLTQDVSGRLDLGCLVTIAPLVTPRLCHEFSARYPAVEIAVVEAGQDALLEGMRTGTLSLAVTYDLELGADISFEGLATLAPYAVVAADHPLARRREVSLAELAGESLVLLDLPHSREYFRSLFAAEGVEPTVGHRSEHPEVIRTMVANGYGYTLINARPVIDQALDGRRVRTIRLAGEPRAMVLGVARLAAGRPTRVVTAFREHCRAMITATSVPGLSADGR
jgi:DNA-binding transcriptional LysR family regulator